VRRAIILALLFGGIQLILPIGMQGQGSWVLLSFGFLILAAYTVGELVRPLGVPKIVGYMLAGALFGPSALGTVDTVGVARLAPISDLAVGLIAFLAGAELRWEELRSRGRMLVKMTLTELAITFCMVTGLLWLMRDFLPFLAASPTQEAVAFCLLFGSVAIVHSPAVTMALLAETRARGPVARATLGVVLIADVAVVLFFSAMLALTRALAPPAGGNAGESLASVVWEITGALGVGALLGCAIAAYLRYVGKDLVFFAILVAFFGETLAHVVHVEVLLTLLSAGFVMENLSREGRGAALLRAMERSAAPIFVVFFALTGARIEFGLVRSLLFLVGPIALVRGLSIWMGMKLGRRWAGADPTETGRVWMGLVSQSGVAIGLVAIVADAYPQRGRELSALLLALVAINEMLGPVLFRRALTSSGEVAAAPRPAGVGAEAAA
jgi:Kef-type K+ transport system membrane component KefB